MKWKQALEGLRAEKNEEISPRQVLNAHYSFTAPTKATRPEFLCWSKEISSILGIEEEESSLNLFSGNKVPEGLKSISTRYGGHQFGQWAGQLGDGRAITLGLIENNGQNFEVQLKGAGLTPYSRMGDGKAVLRSSLREYLCSEAMGHLGVPTTRALSLVTTGESVIRDMFYNGNPEAELGAICTRVSPSFLRFGHYQIHAALNEIDELQQLIDFTLKNFGEGRNIREFFYDLVNKTAFMICEWYRVGFVHGVMNTDNLSILGLTIDYGPFGWMDSFDPDWTPNTTDAHHRRYRFMNQHNIAYWNLAQLSEALKVSGVDLDRELEEYPNFFKKHFAEMMKKKLGLIEYDDILTNRLYNMFAENKADMTLFYRNLISELEGDKLLSWEDCFYNGVPEDLADWLKTWKKQINKDLGIEMMKKSNPVLIPRNYLIQECLDDLAKGDETSLRALEEAIKSPYEWNDLTKRYFKRMPDWAATRPGCSTLSCSS